MNSRTVAHSSGRRDNKVGVVKKANYQSITSQHIGIVACTAEGAALCYRTICREAASLLVSNAHPE